MSIPEECPICDGTGEVCAECGDPETQCNCEESHLYFCDACDGTGEEAEDEDE